jgi:hypothetical protein
MSSWQIGHDFITAAEPDRLDAAAIDSPLFAKAVCMENVYKMRKAVFTLR